MCKGLAPEEGKERPVLPGQEKIGIEAGEARKGHNVTSPIVYARKMGFYSQCRRMS